MRARRPADELDWRPWGLIGRPHGLRGELTLRPFNPASELDLAERTLRLGRTGPDVEHTVRLCRRSGRNLVCRLSGVEDHTAALALRGEQIWTRRSEWPALPAGSYYHADLIGCQALDEAGALLGVVTAVRPYPQADHLVLGRAAAPEVEVPLVAPFIVALDVAAGRIVLRLPPGLLEVR